ncbi:DUF7287 family protein [Halosimplex carlsbadense]|nr:hypothetical protein [Halosimplex carlsbadense]
MSASGDSDRSAATGGRAERVRRGERAQRRRGQTTLDFAIGMSLFLLTLTVVFLFVPGMIDPFTGGAQGETPAADRIADDLVESRLGDPSEPYALDSECTRRFFESGAAPACGFAGGPLQERVGLLDRTPINVTIRGNVSGSSEPAVLCWDSSAESVVEASACNPGGSDTRLSRGSNPAGSGGKTVSARRVALLDGRDVTVEVVLW